MIRTHTLRSRPHRHAVGLAELALALIIGLSPRFLKRTLPGKLEERITQGFDAGMPLMDRGMFAALKGNRRGPSQRLDTGSRRIARVVIAPLRQETGRKTLARPWKPAEDGLIRMRLKKASNLFVVSGQLLKQEKELLDQRQHQA